MSHATHMNESCRSYTFFATACENCSAIASTAVAAQQRHNVIHIQIVHVQNMNRAFHTYEWVMSRVHIFPQQLAARLLPPPSLRSNETCHIYKLVMSHIWIVHVTHIHRKRSLYLPLGSVNLVMKVMGTPDEISSPPGWNRVSPGCPRNFNTELTEPTRQIKTTFPMNMNCAYHTHERVVLRLHISPNSMKWNCFNRRCSVATRQCHMYKLFTSHI